VKTAPDCVGPRAKAAVDALDDGDVLLLENLRFHKEEEAGDEAFARDLASLGDIYVDDAFGTAHRAHASTEGVAHFLPAVAGFLMEKELNYLGGALANPALPFVAILGGAKISDKVGVIQQLLTRADQILIGGGMANTFLKARGLELGDSLVERDAVETAKQLLANHATQLILPTDAVVADKFDKDAHAQVVEVFQVQPG